MFQLKYADLNLPTGHTYWLLRDAAAKAIMLSRATRRKDGTCIPVQIILNWGKKTEIVETVQAI